MEKILFNKGWTVAPYTGAFFQNKAEKIDLPHDGMISLSRTPDAPSGKDSGFYPGASLSYTKMIDSPSEWQGKKVMLEFDGVFMNAEVSLNRNIIAFQPYGYTSFFADLTPYLEFNKQNTIKVIANNSAPDTSRWYSGAGIYRDVWLRIGELVYIKPWSLQVTPLVADEKKSTVSVKVTVENESRKPVIATAVFKVIDEKGKEVVCAREAIVFDGETGTANAEIPIPDAKLWSVDTPDLYKMICEIESDGEIIDRDETTFGIRVIDVSTDFGFKINGNKLKLKGGCIHHDNGPLGAISCAAAEERKIRILKQSGFNAIRSAHNPASPALLAACDKLGMLVIDESFDCWRMGKTNNDYRLYFDKWWQHDLSTMVLRGYNHPCIIMWSIGNEILELTGLSGGNEMCRKMADTVKDIDPSRPITQGLISISEDISDPSVAGNLLANMSGLHFDPSKDIWGPSVEKFVEPLDICGYNYLGGRYEYDLELYPDRVIFGSETYSTTLWKYWLKVEANARVIGDFVWTAWDYIGEAGIGDYKIINGEDLGHKTAYPTFTACAGDIDICGFKKTASYYRDIVWGTRSAPYIGVLPPELYDEKLFQLPWGWPPLENSWTFPGQEGKLTKVEVYSPDDEIELIVNGVSCGKENAGKSYKYTAIFEIPYAPGSITAIGYNDGVEVSRETLKTAGSVATLKLTPDREQISAQNGDLCYVTIEAVDENGMLVPNANPDITCQVGGCAKLIALGSGDPKSTEDFQVTHRKPYNGRMLAIISSVGKAGEALFSATMEGVPIATCKIKILD